MTDPAVNIEETSTTLCVRDLKKDYHDGERTLHVLRGIDLDLARGEAVAITGASGSGKSTFLNLLGLIDRPTSGAILYGDEDYARMNGQWRNKMRRDHLGFVFQFHHLLPEMRAWENVALPAMVAGNSLQEMEGRARELLDAVGLADRAMHLPAKLSGGEQQRVALARALINDPSIILADEPTGNLDLEMGQHVIHLLWEATRARECSLIIVTHEQDIASKADRVLRLHEGVLHPV